MNNAIKKIPTQVFVWIYFRFSWVHRCRSLYYILFYTVCSLCLSHFFFYLCLFWNLYFILFPEIGNFYLSSYTEYRTNKLTESSGLVIFIVSLMVP